MRNFEILESVSNALGAQSKETAYATKKIYMAALFADFQVTIFGGNMPFENLKKKNVGLVRKTKKNWENKKPKNVEQLFWTREYCTATKASAEKCVGSG
jgi:hypothetical protein